ncbi:MAG TPA: nickel-dependent lactate racemase [Terracidiphilus sp.]|nr:nickel-dependent lactate racemase [Terracidiphilus sp.]
MKSLFFFGKSGIEVEVPDTFDCREVRSRKTVAVEDESAAVARALDRPIACEPLVDLARGKKTAAISVCDITRPAPNRITLPPLLDRLQTAGIDRENILILIATGLHRPATKEEIDRIVGPEIAASYRIANHDARAFGAHRHVGDTRRGTPVYVDERFVSADLHITLGFIEQHLMLGFSGGRKLIVPGLAAQETIKVIHSPRFIREPLATEGSIEGNPLHEELLECARMVRHDFIVDVALTQERKIAGVFAGHPVKAHAVGVDFVERACLEEIDEPADVVITSAAGFPLDLTFYQSVKGITAATHIAKPEGRILIVAECAEGMGSAEFARMVRNMGEFAKYLDEVRDLPVDVDRWQVEKLALAGVQNELYFYLPGVAKEELGRLGARAFNNLQEATAAVLRGLPRGARVTLVPEGPYTFARASARMSL